MDKKLIEWADSGDVDSMFKVGEMYLREYGTDQNIERAVEYFTKAAKEDYEDADYQLGIIYRDGLGVAQDYEKAIEYFKKAIKDSHINIHVDAADALFEMCRQGQGVPQNDDETLEFIINILEKPFTNIYSQDIMQRTIAFKTYRTDEFTFEYKDRLEIRRILNSARKLRERGQA